MTSVQPMQPAMANLKSLPYGGAMSVIDPQVQQEIETILQKSPVGDWLTDDEIHLRFVDQYRDWIGGSTLNSLDI